MVWKNCFILSGSQHGNTGAFLWFFFLMLGVYFVLLFFFSTAVALHIPSFSWLYQEKWFWLHVSSQFFNFFFLHSTIAVW